MTVDQVIERWKADEAAVCARLRNADVATQEQLAGRSGMEVFEAIFAGEIPPAPIGDTLDFVPIHVAAGEAVFQGRPQRRHYNPLGTVHGGIVGPNGELYAHATTTCLIFDQPARTRTP